MSTAEITALSAIDPWFLENIREIVLLRAGHRASGHAAIRRRPPARQARWASRTGASPSSCGDDRGRTCARRASPRASRATFKMVDTCAAEFEAHTPYLYSTYEEEDEAPATAREKVVILGSGPNRIGQGIEFDYAASTPPSRSARRAWRRSWSTAIPETVSTDYDTSDRLYFEPLTFEDVMNIVERERPRGVIVQFGGQTPLKLVVALEKAGVPILGTPPDAIDRAEDRRRFAALIEDLGLAQAPGDTAALLRGGRAASPTTIGYPVLVRPSYVLGGRGHADRLRRGGPPPLHDARRCA